MHRFLLIWLAVVSSCGLALDVDDIEPLGDDADSSSELSDSGIVADPDADTDVDVDGDVDTDSDGDVDVDSDMDTDADVDADGDGDSDLDIDTDVDTSGDTDSAIHDTDTAAERGVEWVSFEGGIFLMGSAGGPPDEKPPRIVSLSPFEITETEVTVGQYLACEAAGSCVGLTENPLCNWKHLDRRDHPVNCANWHEAGQACEFLGGRLPIEAEWEFAARSAGLNQTYPWGTETPSCDRVVMVSSGEGCGTGGTFPVCSLPLGNSDQGVCDLSGNLREWVIDCYYEDLTLVPGNGTAHNPDSCDRRVHRGGSYQEGAYNMRASDRAGRNPNDRQFHIGFRCAR